MSLNCKNFLNFIFLRLYQLAFYEENPEMIMF